VSELRVEFGRGEALYQAINSTRGINEALEVFGLIAVAV
jgi:hypothetical protein